MDPVLPRQARGPRKIGVTSNALQDDAGLLERAPRFADASHSPVATGDLDVRLERLRIMLIAVGGRRIRLDRFVVAVEVKQRIGAAEIAVAQDGRFRRPPMSVLLIAQTRDQAAVAVDRGL